MVCKKVKPKKGVGMNQITRRLRELSTGRIKVWRLSKYTYGVGMKLRPTQKKGYKQLKRR